MKKVKNRVGQHSCKNQNIFQTTAQNKKQAEKGGKKIFFRKKTFLSIQKFICFKEDKIYAAQYKKENAGKNIYEH
jgi:hypothetical protein